MTACSHVLSTVLKPPSLHTKIYKEECTQCFDTQDLPLGIDVCLTCFNAGCLDPTRRHAFLHYQKTAHPLVLNIHRLIKDKPKRANEIEEPPQKISKLAIVPESDEDKHEFITHVKCYACGGVEIERTIGQLPIVIDSLMASTSAIKQSEIQAWEEKIIECDHVKNLEQQESKPFEAQALSRCNDCELKENLWMCLICGNIGCGRQQYGGLPGNGHGVAHYEKTKHPASCKLGTISPEGTADVYCYQCHEIRLDPYISNHLATFGIQIESSQKTEKSTTEMQLEHNLKFDFSMTTDDGKELETLYGPGYTGIKNLGNSCYMASVLQSVFSLDAFQQRYYPNALEHNVICEKEAGRCLNCQLSKVADGLLSGRYSNCIEAIEASEEERLKDGITPSMFKALIGEGHQEFSTMRQQDALEFFQHLITMIERNDHTNTSNDPTRIFKFSVQERLQCLECKRVRYSQLTESHIGIPVPARKITNAESNEENLYEPVTLEQCLQSFGADDMIEHYSCPCCNKATQALKNRRFITFPEILVIQLRRFETRRSEFEHYIPRKIPAPVIISEEIINFDNYLAHGKQPNEELLPEENKNNVPQFDQNALDQLLSMGFPEIRSKKALTATGNSGAESAMTWLFEHMDDPDIDVPYTSANPVVSNVSEEDIASLTDMGFPRTRVKKALAETNNNVERAVEWLFSHPNDDVGEQNSIDAETINAKFGDPSLPANYEISCVISHKGTSVHSGHYVAHVRKDGRWVLYNDNKVRKSHGEPFQNIMSSKIPDNAKLLTEPSKNKRPHQQTNKDIEDSVVKEETLETKIPSSNEEAARPTKKKFTTANDRRNHLKKNFAKRVGQKEEYQPRKWEKMTNKETDETQISSDAEEGSQSKDPRKPKRKVAALVGFCGTGYQGMQINPGAKTIEGELFKAFVAAGAISTANSDDPKKLNVVEKINENLPDQIRMWGYAKVVKTFHSKTLCDSRIYEYLIPSYVFIHSPPQPPPNTQFKLTTETPSPISQDFTIDRISLEDIPIATAEEMIEKRKYRIPTNRLETVSDPKIIQNTEWLSLKVHGQSFMLHQIRKMVSMIVLTVRSDTPLSLIEKTFSLDKINIPKAPALGLLLEQPVFNSYNKKAKEKKKDLVSFELYEEKIDKFKDGFIYSKIFAEESAENTFQNWLNVVDYHTARDYGYLNAEGIIPDSAIIKTGEKHQKGRIMVKCEDDDDFVPDDDNEE
ncbi:11276_t:CDS:10 [Ambispora gerdemannii]|uniref:Ubiquitin carboxyl-terminal hydrolase 14 n=1 Tax=Ambispora gerdemannii TaxID=144530 RepID=A0A9N8UWQ1_9GLOM|nr:11276_t:CDS:10 [Ambispora gerdemannii]